MQIYNVGEFVVYNGEIWVATEQTDRQPALKTGWDYAPKFTDENVENFWCMFLAAYLGHCVLIDELPMLWVQIGDNGAIKYNNNEYKASDDGAFTRLQKALYSRKSKIFSNLDFWLTQSAQKENEVFKLYLNNFEDDENCNDEKADCVKRKSRVGRYKFS